jgi:hypothetical protein
MPQFDCRKSAERSAGHDDVPVRPLYPVPVFQGTAVDRVAYVAKFGGYLFAKSARGWRVVMEVEVPGSVVVED